jgi:sugar phosphate isomerase/epimerase
MARYIIQAGQTGIEMIPPLGIFSWSGYHTSLAERLWMVKSAGFESTTIWWGEENELYRTGQKHLIADMVRSEGLYFENIHVPFDHCNDLWSQDSPLREGIISQHLAWIDDCARYEIPMLVMHISRGHRINPNKHGIESLSEIVRAAEDAKVIVAIENTRSIRLLDHVFAEIQSPCLGLCYDSSHDWIYSEEKTGILKRHGHLLLATHFSDNDSSIDRHWIPGEGVIDWNKIAESFPKDTYKGVLTLEVVPSRRGKRISHAEFLKLAYERAVFLSDIIFQKESGTLQASTDV